MPNLNLQTLSGRYLSFAEREEIALLRAEGLGVCEIAERLERSASTVSRELNRNAATRSGYVEYRASTAQWHAERRARRPREAKLVTNEALKLYVQDRLAGAVVDDTGRRIGPQHGKWKGRRHGRRQDRRWATSWSPEQIANRLSIDFPDDPTMRISHEAIYQALYIPGRGALQREFTACLRTGRALRLPRARGRRRGKSFITPEVMIENRPAEADDRKVAGHWEGDLIIGLESSAIGTLVERSSRYVAMVRLPRLEGEGVRVKNGPALAGHGAQAVRVAIASTMEVLPPQLRRSLTWDQGAEMAQHVELARATEMPVYFCEPRSPWQRGTNENTNGLLRQYFPKGTDLSRHSQSDLVAVGIAINNRPRKILNWLTPAEVFAANMASAMQSCVATTG